MTDDSLYIMPERLGNTISKIAKALEQSDLSSQYLPIVPEWHIRCGYIEQIAVQFWIHLVNHQRDTQLTSAYDLPEKVIAQKFIDYLADKAEVYWKARKEYYLAHVDEKEYESSDPKINRYGNKSQTFNSTEFSRRSENIMVTFKNTPSDSKDAYEEVQKCDISFIPVPLSYSEIKLGIEGDINKYQNDNDDIDRQSENNNPFRWSPRRVLTSLISLVREYSSKKKNFNA